MNAITNLIWAAHGSQLSKVISTVNDYGMEEAECEIGELMAALYIDDTFNEYSEKQLQAAVMEAINGD